MRSGISTSSPFQNRSIYRKGKKCSIDVQIYENAKLLSMQVLNVPRETYKKKPRHSTGLNRRCLGFISVYKTLFDNFYIAAIHICFFALVLDLVPAFFISKNLHFCIFRNSAYNFPIVGRLRTDIQTMGGNNTNRRF